MRRLALPMALLVLCACGEQEVMLEGERLDVRGNPVPAAEVNRAAPLSLPAARVNADWTHDGGNPRHQLGHVALDRSLEPAWGAAVGEGNSRRIRLTADPVVSGGRIFAMDSRAAVTALSASGATLWTTGLAPASDAPDEGGAGGGLAAGGGRIFATTGFGTLSALDAANGRLLWQQDLDAAPGGPPMVSGGVVYVATSNATGWAIDADSGRILWQVFGTASARGGIAGGAAPAEAGPLVVFPFSSGQMVAAVAGSGDRAWTASVAGRRLGRAFSAVSDLAGGLVVAGNTIYAASHAGRAAGIDASTGEVLWRAEEGAAGPIWATGGALFFVSDENRLVRLDAATGETVWARDLPFFSRRRISRRKATHVHYGPVLAGGRLILVSDDGMLRQFDPVSGNPLAEQALPDGAAANPVVAGGTLYLLTADGRLHAFR